MAPPDAWPVERRGWSHYPPHPWGSQTQLDDPDVPPAGGAPVAFPKACASPQTPPQRVLSHLVRRSRASTPQLAPLSLAGGGARAVPPVTVQVLL